MPRQPIFRSHEEIEEIKRIRRERNTEIQRIRRQKLREINEEQQKQQQKIKTKEGIGTDYCRNRRVNEDLKQKRRQRNTELQRMRRANLYKPKHKKKSPEEEEVYLAKRRQRNTEIQRLRRQKLRQQKSLVVTTSENADETIIADDTQTTEALLNILQLCFTQLQKNHENEL